MNKVKGDKKGPYMSYCICLTEMVTAESARPPSLVSQGQWTPPRR